MTAAVLELRRGLGDIRTRAEGAEPEDGCAEDPAKNGASHHDRSISPSRPASTGMGMTLDRPIARATGAPTREAAARVR